MNRSLHVATLLHASLFAVESGSADADNCPGTTFLYRKDQVAGHCDDQLTHFNKPYESSIPRL